MIPKNTKNRSDNLMQYRSPTGSYSIGVPEGVIEDVDERIVSFWMKGHNLLLQVSSYARNEGVQVNAAERLADLFKRQPLAKYSLGASIEIDCPDFASTTGIDENHFVWFYAYAVWDDLTIMITVSGNEPELMDNNNWAFTSVRSIRRLEAK
jgi:hypothetical protein